MPTNGTRPTSASETVAALTRIRSSACTRQPVRNAAEKTQMARSTRPTESRGMVARAISWLTTFRRLMGRGAMAALPERGLGLAGGSAADTVESPL